MSAVESESTTAHVCVGYDPPIRVVAALTCEVDSSESDYMSSVCLLPLYKGYGILRTVSLSQFAALIHEVGSSESDTRSSVLSAFRPDGGAAVRSACSPSTKVTGFSWSWS